MLLAEVSGAAHRILTLFLGQFRLAALFGVHARVLLLLLNGEPAGGMMLHFMHAGSMSLPRLGRCGASALCPSSQAQQQTDCQQPHC